MTLADTPPRTAMTVLAVEDISPGDAIARRLRELGFVAGERVEIVGKGPFGGDPLLISVGFTRFALRHTEAARVKVAPADEVQGAPV